MNHKIVNYLNGVWREGDNSVVCIGFYSSLIVVLFLPQIIYVMRNPKDVCVSYYHFSKALANLETPSSFEQFFEDFLVGKGETAIY